MTVRFGNVLGSEGSVLQVFQRQIDAGGPITVTHPDMRRYFMTIPEACQLVLQAAAQGAGGEIFLLDMGEPIKIVDLARDLLTLMGLEPGKDIEITFTGIRRGEKLFEELLSSEMRIVPTAHEKILVVKTAPPDHDALEEEIRGLFAHARAGDETAVLASLKTLVPEYQPGNGVDPVTPKEKRRILLADDDAYTRSTLRRILEIGYEVFEAGARRQVLDQVKACSPDLVILDHAFPAFSVRRLCAQIKARNGRIPPSIILLAESADVVNLAQVRALGADDRLYKPIRVDIVEGRVDALVKRRLVPNPDFAPPRQ
jgi:CheY-like chemotaxis protein